MANLVSKVMLKMKLVENDRVVFVSNPLELLGGFVGQTAPKVEAKVNEAAGGLLSLHTMMIVFCFSHRLKNQVSSSSMRRTRLLRGPTVVMEIERIALAAKQSMF